MRKVGLSIVIASKARPTLQRTLDSITPQLQPGDELLVDINDDCPYGNHARQRTMLRANGTHIMFMDDDDTYLPGAFDRIRATISRNPRRIHMFRMAYSDGRPALWQTPRVEIRNVGTQNIVAPNNPDRLGTWGDRYEGDYDFIASTCARFPDPPVWHEDIIALYRPAS